MNNILRKTIIGGLLSASLAAPAVAGDYSGNSIITPELPKANFGLPSLPSLPSLSGGDNFSFSAGYHSTYLFRGIDFGDDLVDWSIETSFTLGSVDLTAGIWGANVFDVQGGSEVDFYVSTSKDLGFATAELGYIFYYFPDATSSNTQEVYLGLSKEVAGYGLSATWYGDFDAVEGNYLELGAEKTFGPIDASLTVGVNPIDGDFTHAQLTLSKTFALNSEVSLTPYISYSQEITDVDDFGFERDNQLILGASIGFDF